MKSFIEYLQLTEGKSNEDLEKEITKENLKLLEKLKKAADKLVDLWEALAAGKTEFFNEGIPSERMASATRPVYLNGEEYTIVIGVVRPVESFYPLKVKEPVYRFDIWKGTSSWMTRKSSGQVSKCKAPTPEALMAKLKKTLEKITK